MDTKVTNSLQVSVPQGGFVDEGDGVVSFPNGLTITDDSGQRNGTRYDINTLDVSRYGGQLTGDHIDQLGNLIGETIGVVKTDNKVLVSKIRYAINENPYARLAYNLLVGGFSKNFSTETIGPAPDETGVYRNSELVGLSQVVTQNNYNAHVNKFNEVVHNSLEQSKKDGLDVSGIEEKVLNHVEDEHKMEENKETETKETETKTVEEVKETPEVTPETNESKAPAVEEAQEDEGKKIVETPHVPEPEASKTETSVEENKTKETEEVKNDVDDTTEKTPEETQTNNKEEKMDEKDKKVENPSVDANALETAIANAVAAAMKPIAEEVKAAREEAKNAFDASAKEPEFKANEKTEVAKNDYSAMDWEERYNKQVDAAWNAVKLGSLKDQEELRKINQVNLDALKEKGIAKNAITLDDLGNFVIPPEMYDQIVGHRNDYTAILDETEWRETLSLDFAWLQRVGDIDMRNVALGYDSDGTDDERLKPISEYSASPQTSRLEELAAVTVVATSATRFAAVDLLADAAAGYRTDYDRKRAQLVIAKLEQAVDETGYSVAYNPSSDADALTTWLKAITAISDVTLNGTLVFNARTFAELKSRAIKAGANGPLSEILTTGSIPTVFGYRFVVVPNDLMPSLGGTETISHIVDGVAKTINHAVFFADLTTFTGRTSGGLQYDVSNSASYESGGVVKSAYQRNELVLRGSFFRGGAIKYNKVVAGIRQGAGANAS